MRLQERSINTQERAKLIKEQSMQRSEGCEKNREKEVLQKRNES